MQASNLIDISSQFYGKRLLNEALDGFYYFNDDIEEILDEIMFDCQDDNFPVKPGVYAAIWFLPEYKKVKEEICRLGKVIYGSKED